MRNGFCACAPAMDFHSEPPNDRGRGSADPCRYVLHPYPHRVKSTPRTLQVQFLCPERGFSKLRQLARGIFSLLLKLNVLHLFLRCCSLAHISFIRFPNGDLGRFLLSRRNNCCEIKFSQISQQINRRISSRSLSIPQVLYFSSKLNFTRKRCLCLIMKKN